MKCARGWFLGIVVGLFSLGAGGEVRAQTFQWDLVGVPSLAPITIIVSGGVASALAGDGSRITVTGSGTFVVQDPGKVTGGGVWITRDPLGVVTGFGTYQVTGLIAWNDGPGTVPPEVVNKVVNQGVPGGAVLKSADARSGLLVLRVAYSDGGPGLLVVNCALPVGKAPSGYDGISATKGFVNYGFTLTFRPPVDVENGTLFTQTAPKP
jgi:hypothetical protein